MRLSRLLPVGVLAAALATLVLTAPAAPVAAAEKPAGDANDRFWVAPDLAQFPVTSIALLPIATYDDNAEHRKMIEAALGPALKGTGHRWVSSFLVRDKLMRTGGDSLAKALNDQLLADLRLDSLSAPFYSRTLRARALLTVRADQMERVELEPIQSGRPSTTVQLRAALVDSTGRLLWTAHSNETLLGQRQEAGGNIIGVKTSGINNTAVGLTTQAPLFPEVLGKIAARWGEAFPRLAPADSARTAK